MKALSSTTSRKVLPTSRKMASILLFILITFPGMNFLL
jgi:hypothetical protein